MNRKKKITIIIVVVLCVLITIGGIIGIVHWANEKQKQQEWENAVKGYRQAKIEQYQRENNEYADYEVDVAFLGDSLTDGYDLKVYYPQFTVVNRGIGGDTTFDLEERLQVSVYDLKPKVAVMLIGANNFYSMFDNYERIVQGLKNNLPGTKIVLLSLTSMRGEHWGAHNEIASFNNVKIKILAEKYGCEFVDLYTPLFDYESNGIKGEYTTDGGHLTPKGYEVVTAEVTPVLENLLGEWV